MRGEDGGRPAPGNRLRAGGGEGVQRVGVEEQGKLGGGAQLPDEAGRPVAPGEPRSHRQGADAGEVLDEHRRRVASAGRGAVVRERQEHGLRQTREQRRGDRRRQGDRDQPGAGAQRAAGGEGGGAGHAARAGDEQHVAEGALVALRVARREVRGQVPGRRQPQVAGDEGVGAGRETDVRQPEAPDVPRRRDAATSPGFG